MMRRVNPNYPPTPKLKISFDDASFPCIKIAPPYSLLASYLEFDTQGLMVNVQMLVDQLEGARIGIPIDESYGEAYSLSADRNTTTIQRYDCDDDVHAFPTRIVLEAARAWLAYMQRTGRRA